MELKSIIQGRLNFGNEKSYANAFKMYQHRIENFYKSDILLTEEMFDEEGTFLDTKRIISQGAERIWTNTVHLLEYLADYAMAGNVSAWLVKEGKILRHTVIEPSGDKAVIQSFIKGKKLAGQKGNEKEAIEALTKVINKHDSHAQAYDRRGYVNYILGNMDDVIYDCTKAIQLDPSMPTAYYWRARAHVKKDDLDSAIADYDMTTKKAIALQPIYWKARRRKGLCHLEKKEPMEAEREFRLYTSRKFATDDPNYPHLRPALFEYAKLLMDGDKYSEAIEALDKALDVEDKSLKSDADLLALRTLAEKNSN